MAAKKKGNQKKAKNKAKKVKAEGGGDAAPTQRNPKAFSFQSTNKAKSARARSAEKEQRRLHAPLAQGLESDLPPPMVVLVQGPPGVGKSTLIKCMVKHYTKQNLAEVKGPITVVAGKTRRITFIECPQDLHGMLDAAKYADLVLLMIDGAFGFEMETFEFLNLLQVHGFPRVMGVLTHLDSFKEQSHLKKTKKALKARFWTEIYDGAKLFYLSGLQHGKYLKREVLNLARFISVTKTRPLTWRIVHPYMVADRMEDLTPRELVRTSPKCDRDVVVYGYLRGTTLKQGTRVHMVGVGDHNIVGSKPLKANDAGMGPETGSDDDEQGSSDEEGDDEEEEDRRSNRRRASSSGASSSSGSSSSGDEDSEGISSDKEDGERGVGLNGWGHAHVGGKGDGRVRRPAPPSGSTGELLAARGDGYAEMGGHAGGEDMSSGEEGESSGDGAEDDEEEEEEEGLGAAARWKQSLGATARKQEEAASSVHTWLLGSTAKAPRGCSLTDLVYGNYAGASVNSRHQLGFGAEDDDAGAGGGDEGSSDDEEFFRPKKRTNEVATAHDLAAEDALDSSRPLMDTAAASSLSGISSQEDMARLRNRFVTGDWGEGKKRAMARPRKEGEEDDSADEEGGFGSEVEGEFEDVETGQKFGSGGGSSGDAVTDAAMKAIRDAEAEELRAKKAAQKAAFNAQYDEGGSKGEDREEAGLDAGGGGPPRPKVGTTRPGGEVKEETYYDAVKRDMAERAMRTRAAMDALKPSARAAIEGIRPGTYVRMRFTGVSYELVAFHDPRRPLLIGGLGQDEDKLGVTKLRFKRHRWFPKILKSRDPLVFSWGWRRFQSLPLYALEDHNRRLRSIKYTPEHMHCIAAVFGPIAPQNTGVVAIQARDGAGDHSHARKWRISGTGVVLEVDADMRVVKKLKLVGTPAHINRHTAFIQGMFNSQLEAAKFEGAQIRTVSGVRGTVKKALRPGGALHVKDGTFRATFEDKILSSDIVFLKAWVAVDLPRFYNPVTNLLAPAPPPATLARKKPAKSKDNAAEDPAERASKPGVAHILSAAAAAAAAKGSAGTPAPHQLAQPLLASAPKPAVAGAPAPATAPQAEFLPSPHFAGPRPGYFFKKGPSGLGYYLDAPASSAPHQQASTAAPAPSLANGQASMANGVQPSISASGGWVGMRTVADLRRAHGVGAPRNPDSLYKPDASERAPRKFNPLRIPQALQAALPFKTTPKLEAARKPGKH
ncbi:BMS1-like protein [Dunaliella salina]|uniref:BMS1-like protein n=1 Tax=Dunaliella salina TaxID=3046 RepID=A0ABQ7GVH5_DUNSA|nr:BMS1-like protein [Dunaliella salina]|eukprot:KAF5838557.1 BMS1-like protein [Dunaliella salina]